MVVVLKDWAERPDQSDQTFRTKSIHRFSHMKLHRLEGGIRASRFWDAIKDSALQTSEM